MNADEIQKFNVPNHASFSIYREFKRDLKRCREAEEIWWFLLTLVKLIKLDDVEFGSDPPDFIFHVANKQIGVELTDINPQIFEKDGYLRRSEFKLWQKEADARPQPFQEFSWGEFSIKDLLAAFDQQLNQKSEKAKCWKKNFPEKWLLAHVGSGSPLGGIFATREKVIPGREEENEDYKAKVIYSLHSICQKPHSFDYVILFSGPNVFPFPANNKNPYKLSVAKPEVLERGLKASNKFLDWTVTSKSCKRQLSWDEIKTGKIDLPL